jgi:hypothetical protein
MATITMEIGPIIKKMDMGNIIMRSPMKPMKEIG